MENLCDERLKWDIKDWGRDLQIYPKCYVELEAERDRLKALNAEMLKALKQAYELIPPPTPGSLGEIRIMRANGVVKAAIAKAEGVDCVTKGVLDD